MSCGTRKHLLTHTHTLWYCFTNCRFSAPNLYFLSNRISFFQAVSWTWRIAWFFTRARGSLINMDSDLYEQAEHRSKLLWINRKTHLFRFTCWFTCHFYHVQTVSSCNMWQWNLFCLQDAKHWFFPVWWHFDLWQMKHTSALTEQLSLTTSCYKFYELTNRGGLCSARCTRWTDHSEVVPALYCLFLFPLA